VAQRMERHALSDAGRVGRLMEQAVELAASSAGRAFGRKQPASAIRVVESKPRRRVFHHWRNRSSVSGDSKTLRSLHSLDCSTPMIFCALSMCKTFSLTTSPAVGSSHRRG
jgi:hypothetical protein